jgi:hypothetical protein
VAIEFNCTLCGAACSAEEARVGQTIKCPSCGKDVQVPAPADAPTAEVVAEGESAMQSLQATVGKGDVDEMIFQITGKRPTSPTTPQTPNATGTPATAGSAPEGTVVFGGSAPASGSPAPGSPAPGSPASGSLAASAAAAAAQAGEAPKTRRRPPKGLDRAKHHYGFKKVMWIVSTAVGLVCLGLAVYCFLPKASLQSKEIPTFEEMARIAAPDIAKPVLVEKITAKEISHWWIVEEGAEVRVEGTGKVVYDRDGFDVPAVLADEWVASRDGYKNVLAQQAENESKWHLFGIAFGATGAVLAALGLWMLSDVIRVRRDRKANEPPAAPGAAPADAAKAATPTGTSGDTPKK